MDEREALALIRGDDPQARTVRRECLLDPVVGLEVGQVEKVSDARKRLNRFARGAIEVC